MPRRRKSAEAKRRAGTYRPSNARDVVELPPGRPRAPSWLKPAAKQEFDRVARALSEAGALSEAHRSTLTIYATLWGEYEAAKGKMATARLGELRRLTSELGISPRSGSVAPEPEEPQRPAGDNVVPLGGKREDFSARLKRIARTLEPTKPQEPKP